MNQIDVDTYSLSWSATQNRGFIVLNLRGGQKAQIEVDSAAELSALGELLRSSQQITFEPAAMALATKFLPVGSQ